jgi:hypothetical protein
MKGWFPVSPLQKRSIERNENLKNGKIVYQGSVMECWTSQGTFIQDVEEELGLSENSLGTTFKNGKNVLRFNFPVEEDQEIFSMQ